MRYNLNPSDREYDVLGFVTSIEGQDVWFKALANYDWMYYLKVLEVYPDRGTCLCEYYDCDNPDQALIEGYDTMEVEIASIEIAYPLEILTTEELEEEIKLIEADYAENGDDPNWYW